MILAAIAVSIAMGVVIGAVVNVQVTRAAMSAGLMDGDILKTGRFERKWNADPELF